MRFFNAILTSVFLLVAVGNVSAGGTYTQAQIDEDNDRVDVIVKNLQRNGPPELQRLSTSVIRSTARTLVIGERMGTISAAQMSRIGGAEKATKDSLMGQLRALGSY